MIFYNQNYDEEGGDNYGIDYPHNMLVGFYPYPEANAPEDTGNNSFINHYRAVACTYQMEMQLVSQPSEIILLDDKRPWISIEEIREGHESVPYNQFDYPDEAIYLVGNTKWRHISETFRVDQVVHIETPGGYGHPLYGSQAAAIVMQHQFSFLAQEADCEKVKTCV